MGKAATTEMKKSKKKKGRPSLLDLQKRALNQQHPTPVIPSNPSLNNTPIRRSTRRNPLQESESPVPGFDNSNYDNDEDEEEEDERKEKKVKLVVRLPQLDQHFHQQTPSSANSLSYDSNAEDEDHKTSIKKRRINAVGDRSEEAVANQGEKASKATDILHGSPLESGPTAPLPDRKLLVFILDRLQKKDTYGVFSEPVDPNELPDYHEIIEQPMDFGTVRKKLHDGLYSSLEELEKRSSLDAWLKVDVLLICSNAMQYNAPDTVYFRQARSIQELAKRDFDNLKQEGEDGEPQPKVVRRGRPPSKSLKKTPGRPPVEHAGPELSPDATLATGDDDVIGSNSYNLRRGPMFYRYRANDELISSNQSRNGENHTEWASDWNNEFPASILRADMKHGKKHFSLDENKRDTYKQFNPSALGHFSSTFINTLGNMKQLMPVGLHLEHVYARSMARFAADLGPAVWRVASKKIERVLTPGLKFGPGWVGENEGSPRPLPMASDKQKSSNKMTSDGYPSHLDTTAGSGMNSVVALRDSLSCKEEMVETRRVIDLHVPQSSNVVTRPSASIQTQQKPVLRANRNGFNGALRHGPPSQLGMLRSAAPAQPVMLQEASLPHQTVDMGTYKYATMPSSTAPINKIDSEQSMSSDNSNVVGKVLASDTAHNSHTASPEVKGPSKKPSWQALSQQQQPRDNSLSVPPDLNVRFQSPNSSNSSLQIGSPQQPDLALQL